MRNVDAVAVADAGGGVSKRGLLDQRGRDEGEHALDLRDIDVLALSGALLVQ